ncbi:MAG: prealbumin-like fold domain-containing protein [Pyrinomonadaceae bacterium]
MVGFAQTPEAARGVIRLRVRVKTGNKTTGLSRKRFFLLPGTLEQNKALIQTIENSTIKSRDCYYRGTGASEALLKWLREGDCESVYCREIESPDIEAVPEFQRAFITGEQELKDRDLARKWLTVNLPENIRDGFYKARQIELQKLIKQAEHSSGAKVLSVMTDTKGTAYFTGLPVGTYVISNLLPAENGNANIFWNCEIKVKAGDLSTEKPFLISNVREGALKCLGVERPLPACDVSALGARSNLP